jgi:hypothetical protein
MVSYEDDVFLSSLSTLNMISKMLPAIIVDVFSKGQVLDTLEWAKSGMVE